MIFLSKIYKLEKPREMSGFTPEITHLNFGGISTGTDRHCIGKASVWQGALFRAILPPVRQDTTGFKLEGYFSLNPDAHPTEKPSTCYTGKFSSGQI